MCIRDRFQIRLSDCVITAYTSNKVVFQGAGSAFHASSYQSVKQHVLPKKHNVSYPHCGSDEVGTGDVFGPVVVCATYVTEADLPFLHELGVQDSKAIKDDQILKIAPLLMKRLPHSLLILSNEKYNIVHQSNNLNAIKAKLHNQAYLHLKKKVGSLSTIYLDQFTTPTSYYRYLKNEKEIVTDIIFETKAENQFLAVACGSIIARYAYLQAMQSLNETYAFTFPKGAGKAVDDAILSFIKQYGSEALKCVSKLHFANIQKALKEIN